MDKRFIVVTWTAMLILHGGSLAQNTRVWSFSFDTGFEVLRGSNMQTASLTGEPITGLIKSSHFILASGFPMAPPLENATVVPNTVQGLPTAFTLEQNYPNPFNPSTTIRFDLPQRSQVDLTVYNILGQLTVTLLDEQRNAGRYSVLWEGINTTGSRVSSGVYFYRIRARSLDNGKEIIQTKKLMLLK